MSAFASCSFRFGAVDEQINRQNDNQKKKGPQRPPDGDGEGKFANTGVEEHEQRSDQSEDDADDFHDFPSTRHDGLIAWLPINMAFFASNDSMSASGCLAKCQVRF